MLNVDAILNWPFEDTVRDYSAADAARYAAGFGAGQPGEMSDSDSYFLNGENTLALPMIAVPLADGEFWQQNPKTGIDWRKIVHASESIRVYQPLPAEGVLTLKQRVQEMLDRGPDKGAVMIQHQDWWQGDTHLATIEVSTVLLGDGGFGGKPDTRPRERWVPDDRPCDCSVDVATPDVEHAIFALDAGLAVAAGAAEGQLPLRGVCSFGLAGRAALHLLCGNDPAKLKFFGVRYAGLMFTGETMRVEAWHLEEGKAALRMSSVERDKPVLSQCLVEFSA
jgi:hypothetical protein